MEYYYVRVTGWQDLRSVIGHQGSSFFSVFDYKIGQYVVLSQAT